MEEPPRNIEEFLKSQNWDYWPRDVLFEDNDTWEYTLNKIKEDCSFPSIYTHLQENVPRIYDAQLNMESRLQECSTLLENHAAKIFEWHSIILGSQGKLEKYKAFLRKYHKKKMIMLSDDMDTKKNIEGCNFPGFKRHALTQLPRKLDPGRIFVFILKAQNFEEKFLKIWRSHFLSEASIALLHDCFWWWFLHKFKPDKENEDSLFDRISESYTRLFMSIPLNQKDAFFQVYPDCLAQAIYAAFQEAFPESSDLFSDVFKEDLGNNIVLWLSGLKPQKGFWTHWKVKELSTTTLHDTKRAPLISAKERIARSQERILNARDFNMMKNLKSPTAHTMSTSREESRLPKLTTKPITPPAPTYCDIIKESKRQFARNQKDFRMEKFKIDEEIKFLRQRQERIDKELDRLQAKATKKPYEVEAEFQKFLHKLRSQAQVEREFLASPSSASTTEDHL